MYVRHVRAHPALAAHCTLCLSSRHLSYGVFVETVLFVAFIGEGFCIPCPSPVTRGRTSLWTSSQDCHVPLVTRSSLPSWIDSPRLPILFPCLNSLPPLRLLTYSLFMFFGCMGFPRTLCLTGDLSLCHVCGRGFVLPWGWGQASPRAITHSLIDKLKGRTNNWNPHTVVWFWLILLPGALISPG